MDDFFFRILETPKSLDASTISLNKWLIGGNSVNK
jgi:hypothetical protein